MKKLLSVLAAVVVCSPFFYLASSRYQANRDALSDVGETLTSTNQHGVAVLEGGARVLVARHNVEVVMRATEYMSIFGSGTDVFQEIARIASVANKQCELLGAVLDLAARSTSDATGILALAERACAAEGTPDEAAWLAAYEEMSAKAEYPSIEAAIADQQ